MYSVTFSASSKVPRPVKLVACAGVPLAPAKLPKITSCVIMTLPAPVKLSLLLVSAKLKLPTVRVAPSATLTEAVPPATESLLLTELSAVTLTVAVPFGAGVGSTVR